MITEIAGRWPVDTQSDALEQEMEWERAAKILDLDRGLLRRLRTPQIEFVSHHDTAGGPASCYLAASRLSQQSIATVFVSKDVNAKNVAEEAIELAVPLALDEIDQAGASIGVRLPSGALNEEQLFCLASECAAVLSRVLGAVRLIPSSVPSIAFSNWVASSSACYGARLSATGITPERHLAIRANAAGQAVAHLARLALEERGKTLRSGRLTMLVADPGARETLLLLSEGGARCVAFADESGAIADEAGFEISRLLEHLEGGGLAAEYSEGQHLLHDEALAVPADLLLVQSSKLELCAANIGSVAPDIVLEASRHCLQSAAQNLLGSRGILVVPYELVNSSELLGNSDPPRTGGLWRELCAVRKRHEVPLPLATILLALQRLAERERNARPW